MNRPASEPVEVVDYDPAWPAEYERLRRRALDALGELAVAAEHIGSTAVPGLAAKPIVDLVVVVRSAQDLARAVERLRPLGYVPGSRLDIPGRQPLVWPAGERRHHLNLCLEGSDVLRDWLRFRDRLRAEPEAARRYGELKRRLADAHRDDREAYGAGKTAFVQDVLAR